MKKQKKDHAPEVVALFERLDREAREGGYTLNPDREMTLALVEGLHTNQGRYGYLMCPCRLAFGVREKDLDLICPCDYRDADLGEFDACYCT
jgi:ferredoxin-thioredoxin reductase catalytic subunit